MIGVNVTLRAMEPEDVTPMYLWENDPEVWNFGDRKWPISIADLAELVRQSDADVWQTRQVRFMVSLRQSRQTVGCVDLFNFDPYNLHCEVAVLILSEFRRRGLAHEALSLLHTFAQDVLGVKSFLVFVQQDNEPSKALFAKLGYQVAGTLRKWSRCRDSFSDVILFQRVV